MKTYILLFLIAASSFAQAQQTDAQVWQETVLKGIEFNKNQQYDSALIHLESSFEIAQKIFTDEDWQLELSAGYLGAVYNQLQQYGDAERMMLLRLKITERIQGKKSESYGTGLSTLGKLYVKMGEYSKALPLFIEALKNTEKSLGKNHVSYGICLNDLARLHQSMGEYSKAKPLFIEALSITESNLGKEHASYGIYLSGLAGLYQSMGEYNKALPLHLEALENIKKNLGKDHSSYGACLSNLGRLYQSMGEYNKALPLYLEALENTEKKLGNQHSSYGIDLNNLAALYSATGKYSKALPLYIEALENTEKCLGKEHSSYGTSLSNLAVLYKSIGRYNKAFPYYISANSNLLDQIEEIFGFRSESEKKAFLKTVFFKFDIYQSFDFESQNRFNAITEMNLNNQLLLKGLLLNSSKDVLEKLTSLEDETIDNKILELRSDKAKLNKQYSLSVSDWKFNTDSLSELINTQEAALVVLYQEKFGDDVSLIKDWKEIQSKLKPNEVAIEFSHFNYHNAKQWTDSTLYGAYLIKKEWSEPKVVYLFEEKALSKLIGDKTPNQLYANLANSSIADSIYSLIWKPLEEHLSGTETIYYATDGLLHQIPFAALGKKEAKSVSQQYNLVQLGSTAELANKQKANPTNELFLIGGIDYSYDTTQGNEKEEVYSFTLNAEDIKRSASTHTRGVNWAYLPGTQKEIDQIQKSASESKKVTVLSGKEATEESFKNLSGNSPSVLHIATHGFFFENPKKERREMQGKPSPFTMAEDPLLRSGLLLARGNYAWLNGGNPFEKEDGVLTSLEISNLDLGNTELVVLSACETGLGVVDGNEGVYGLQRAFKMAGVRYIMMSLWQVPDKETAEFMTLFYDNWLGGQTIRAAFNTTQNLMQTKYPTEPEKWAAFVLVN